jgi:hypothetical protein
MNQPDQRIDVDIIEPAGREAHHVLLFALARMAAGSHGEAEDPVPLVPVAGHGPLRGSRRRRVFLVKLCDGGTTQRKRGAWHGSVSEVTVLAAILAA